MGTWGRETRDLGTSSMGRGDVWDGDAGTIMIIEKVGGKCDISHFSREYVLVKATHPTLLRVPPCLFTKRTLGEDPLHRRKLNRSPGLLADGILEPKVG